MITYFLCLSYFWCYKSLSWTWLRKYICSCWVGYDDVGQGTNHVFGEHKVNLLTKGVEGCWRKKVQLFLTWKLASHAMEANVSQTISCILVCLLLWVHHKRWTPIRSIDCVHTHWGMPTIKRVWNPSHVQNVILKIAKDSWNFERFDQVVNWALDPRLEHDKV